ncbi:MAG TPA: response regulator [Candidatus Methylomirabilis sp.]|nr:response regulator [Candidatus Methylomirabilis sp.]
MGLKSILLADDDRFFLEAVGGYLQEQGYTVRHARDGLEALQAIREAPPDFIILDLIMPKVDGGRVCRYVREDPRLHHTPIVVFSALAARDITGMPEVSADAYVAKGPLQIVTKNVLAAIHHLETYGRSSHLDEAVFGYEGFRPRRVVTELLSAKRHADHLLQQMSEGVLRADEADRIFYANPPALAMLGMGEPDLIGARLWEIFGATNRGELEKTAAALRADPKTQRRELAVDLRGRRLKASVAPFWDNEAYAGALILLAEVGDLRQRGKA